MIQPLIPPNRRTSKEPKVGSVSTQSGSKNTPSHYPDSLPDETLLPWPLLQQLGRHVSHGMGQNRRIGPPQWNFIPGGAPFSACFLFWDGWERCIFNRMAPAFVTERGGGGGVVSSLSSGLLLDAPATYGTLEESGPLEICNGIGWRI